MGELRQEALVAVVPERLFNFSRSASTRHHKAVPGQSRAEELCNPFSLQEGRQSFLGQGGGGRGKGRGLTFERRNKAHVEDAGEQRGNTRQMKQPHLSPQLRVCLPFYFRPD